MEPVTKVQARTDALRVLGLSQDASANDIRDAWRNIAFQAHPDHTGGDYGGFSRAKTAYDFLRKEGFATRRKVDDTAPRRPRLKRRLIDLKSAEIEACKGLLNPDPALEYAPDGAQKTQGAGKKPSAASDHIPDAVGCYGRDLTYFVPSSVCKGENRIALPTSLLASGKKHEADILTFQSKNAGGGEIIIPDTICARKFPGAKSVKIRFEADQDVRDSYWLAS